MTGRKLIRPHSGHVQRETPEARVRLARTEYHLVIDPPLITRAGRVQHVAVVDLPGFGRQYRPTTSAGRFAARLAPHEMEALKALIDEVTDQGEPT